MLMLVQQKKKTKNSKCKRLTNFVLNYIMIKKIRDVLTLKKLAILWHLNNNKRHVKNSSLIEEEEEKEEEKKLSPDYLRMSSPTLIW